MRRQAGFTLIEVLIALVVTTAVIALSSFAYSMYSQRWQTNLGSFDRDSMAARSLWQVQTALASAVPFVVWDEAQREYVYYFLGDEQGVTFVSQGTVLSPETAGVVRLFAERQDNGQYRLVYEEAPLKDTRLRTLDQQLQFELRLVLLRDLPRVAFSYFGFESAAAKFGESESYKPPEWFQQFDGAKRKTHPEKLRIDVGGTEILQALPQGHPDLMELFIKE